MVQSLPRGALFKLPRRCLFVRLCVPPRLFRLSLVLIAPQKTRLVADASVNMTIVSVKGCSIASPNFVFNEYNYSSSRINKLLVIFSPPVQSLYIL